MNLKQRLWFLVILKDLKFALTLCMDIDEVTHYKYLGNIISSTRLPNQDPLKNTHKFLSAGTEGYI